MYIAARSWGIQPSEFWDMTLSEYLLEAYHRMDQTPEGRASKNARKWSEQAQMSDEEWWSQHDAS